MCSRHSISDRLRTSSWFQPDPVKFILSASTHTCTFKDVALKELKNGCKVKLKICD